jgi:hypothetical protein
MALEDTTCNFYGPKKFGDLSLVTIQATVAGGSGAATRDADNSSPGTTIARTAAGQYDITFPAGQTFHPLFAGTLLAEQLGSAGFLEAASATAGTATYEFGTTPGTAAEVADNTRIYITFLVGKN